MIWRGMAKMRPLLYSATLSLSLLQAVVWAEEAAKALGVDSKPATSPTADSSPVLQVTGISESASSGPASIVSPPLTKSPSLESVVSPAPAAAVDASVSGPAGDAGSAEARPAANALPRLAVGDGSAKVTSPTAPLSPAAPADPARRVRDEAAAAQVEAARARAAGAASVVAPPPPPTAQPPTPPPPPARPVRTPPAPGDVAAVVPSTASAPAPSLALPSLVLPPPSLVLPPAPESAEAAQVSPRPTPAAVSPAVLSARARALSIDAAAAAQAAASAALVFSHLRARADALLSQHRAIADRLGDSRKRLEGVAEKATQQQPLTVAAVRSASAALDAATRLSAIASAQLDAVFVVVGTSDDPVQQPLASAHVLEVAQAHAQRNLTLAATAISDFDAHTSQAAAAVGETAATLADELVRSARLSLAALDAALAEGRTRYENLDFRVLVAPAEGRTLSSTPSTAALLHVGSGAPLAVPQTPSRAATVLFGKSVQSMRDAASAVLACKGKLVQVRKKKRGKGVLVVVVISIPLSLAGDGCARDDDGVWHSHA